MDNNNGLNTHILTNSATMMGVCLTAIGLVKLVEVGARVASRVDEYLAVDMLFFTLAALLSYLSLRYAGKRRAARLEAMADHIFVAGLLLMALCSVMFAFEFV